MKNVHLLIALFSISIALLACQPKPEKSPTIEFITDSNSEALGPYFTRDHKGNPVLCWTEQGGQDSLYSLRYSVYDLQTNQFGEPITVLGSEGSSTAAESMSKVAFKSDGTVIALFNKAFKGSASRFASAIYYVLSNDEGKSWTVPQFIHSETSEDYGRSFFDMCTLADGEVAAIWLDGRLGDAEKGSALFFASTESGGGFEEEICLDKNTCECCRTDLQIDKDGGIHVAYRGIQLPLDHMGKQVRDMLYIFSNDNGKSFKSARAIGKDNWEIEGCPHTGPSLAFTKGGVNAVWFTGGGIPGLYFSSLENGTEEFAPKTEISQRGRHPQMVTLTNDQLAIVWDEVSKGKADHEKKGSTESAMHDHGNMNMTPSSSEGSRVVLALLNNGKVDREVSVSNDSQIAHHPVIINTEGGVLISWVDEEGGRSRIASSFIEIN